MQGGLRPDALHGTSVHKLNSTNEVLNREYR